MLTWAFTPIVVVSNAIANMIFFILINLDCDFNYVLSEVCLFLIDLVVVVKSFVGGCTCKSTFIFAKSCFFSRQWLNFR